MNDSKGKRERRETSRESRLPATHTTPRLWSDWINKRKVLFIYSLKRRKSILKSIHNTLYTEWNERNVRVFCFRRFTLFRSVLRLLSDRLYLFRCKGRFRARISAMWPYRCSRAIGNVYATNIREIERKLSTTGSSFR